MIQIITAYALLVISCYHRVLLVCSTGEGSLRYSKAITLLTFDVDGTLIKVEDFDIKYCSFLSH